MSPFIPRYDAVVIGAGVIGSSIAYHLADAGVSVLVLERGEIGAGTSGACDGMVFLQSKRPGIHLRLALAGREHLETLSRNLPLDMEWEPTGGMVVIESEAEMEAMRIHVAGQREAGLEVEILDRDRTLAREPNLSGHILGCAWSPLDGRVNPLTLTLGLAVGARKRGADLRSGEGVQEVIVENGRAVGVRTAQGEYRADAVIDAAGVWAPEPARSVGVHLPILPRRGQLLVTEAAGPVLGVSLLSASYIAAKYDPSLTGALDKAASIEQTRSGTLLIGSTREFVGFDSSTTRDGRDRVAANASRLVPALSGMRMIRSFAGLRPFTPDGLPILGASQKVPGFFVAAGHEGAGIALSAVTGRLMADLITTGKTDFPLQDFQMERFS